jgi:hypothetical protein
MFKVVDLIKTTGATSSVDVSAIGIGDFVSDGEIIWVCKEYSSYYPDRLPSTSYRLGTSCNIGNKSFEVVSYIGKTGYLSPSFEKAYYDIIDTVTPKQIIDYKLGDGSYFQLIGDQRQYFELGSSVVASTDAGYSTTFTVFSTSYSESADKTNIYLTKDIDTYRSNILRQDSSSSIEGSAFVLPGNKLDYYQIGDFVRGLGVKTEFSTNNKISFSQMFTVINITLEKPSDTEEVTVIRVKGALPANVQFNTLVAAGYTTLKSKYNNSFVINGNVSDFFLEDNLIKAKTDEGSEMTFVVDNAFYQGSFGQTFVSAKQEISSTTNYTKLAPAWKGTEDGEILWKIIENPTVVQYDWNTYNDIKYKSIINH